MLLIKNGKILTMAGSIIDGGDILIDGGSIVAVAEGLSSDSAEELDATDCFVFPGFIDSHCHIGLESDSFSDIFMTDNPMLPTAQVLPAINFNSKAFEAALRAGVTSVCVSPPGNNLVCGRCALIKTAATVQSNRSSDKTHRVSSPYCAMKLSLHGRTHIQTMEQLTVNTTMLCDELMAARAYINEKTDAPESEAASFTSNTLESYAPLLRGEIPVLFSVYTTEELKAAIRIGTAFSLLLCLVICSDEIELEDKDIQSITEKGIRVVIDPIITGKSMDYRPLQRLATASIPFTLSTRHPKTNIQYLPICAGLAARHNVAMESVLSSITVNAAKLLKCDNIGTLEKGRDADIAIFDANPLEVFTRTLYTIVDGKIVYSAQKESIAL